MRYDFFDYKRDQETENTMHIEARVDIFINFLLIFVFLLKLI